MANETITVHEAIKKGRWQLFFLPMIIMFSIMGFAGCIISFSENGSTLIPIAGFSGILGSPFISLLYILIMLPRWQIWAFSNVRNVHELKQRAILGQFYYKDSSFIWRLVIKNAAQKEQIAQLEQKFEQPDIFINDPNLPFETSYAYSRVQNFFYVLFFIGFLGCSVMALVTVGYLIGLFCLAGCAMLGWVAYKRLRNPGPILIISNDGITTKDNGFHSWSEIQNERITFTSAGKASYYALQYDLYGSPIKMKLTELTGLSSYKIDPILRTYRGRYEANKLRIR